MTALGSSKIWILVPDWSRLKSSEPKAGDVTRKIGPQDLGDFTHGFISFSFAEFRGVAACMQSKQCLQ